MSFSTFRGRAALRAIYSALILTDLSILGFVCVPDVIADACDTCAIDGCDDGTGGGDTNRRKCEPIAGRSACQKGSGCTYVPESGCSDELPYDEVEDDCIMNGMYCQDHCQENSGG